MKRIELLLMAAGESKRFGGGKQLAVINNQPIVLKQLLLFDQLSTYLAKQHIQLNINLVLGAYAEEIIAKISDENIKVTYLINPNWQQGLGNSIAYATKKVLMNNEYVDAISICLLDQVALTFNDFQLLFEQVIQHKNNHVEHSIICASYQQHLGVPAIFPPNSFTQLTQLQGDVGARKIIEKNSNQAIAIKNAAIDIDTKQQLASFQQQQQQQYSN